MSTVEADDPSRRQSKKENGADGLENGRRSADVSVDYNQLYGDLYEKLLSTPVQDIFPHTFGPGNSKENNGMKTETPAQAFSPMLQDHGRHQPEVLKLSQMNDGMFQHGVTSPLSQHPGEFDPARFMPPVLSQEEMEKIASKHEFIDIPRLVEDFRLSLERYGVSQRFAARFIMHDTSQGNLSFLMEKGKTKSWADISVKGRIPYIKMKAWLSSKEQQLLTLEMIKQSQEMKKYYSPREPYNRRERFSMVQLQVLCQLFEENSNPPMITRSSVAQRLNIPLDRVNVWFQNQRARGFPAKKILQSSLYAESVNAERGEKVQNGGLSPIDTRPSMVAMERKEQKYVPLDNNEEGDPFALLQRFTSSKLGEIPKEPAQNQGVTQSLPSTPLSTSNMGRPMPEVTPPIDFSSFPFTYNYSHGQSHGQSNSGSENIFINQNSPGSANVKAKSTEKQPENLPSVPKGGAAKRKRGKRPQQIIRVSSPVLPEEWQIDDYETLSQSKRAKFSESVCESNDKDNSSSDTNHSSDSAYSASNGLDIRTSEHVQSSDGKSSTTNQNDNICDVSGNSTNGNTNGGDKAYSEETLVALKSVCAHILMAENETEKSSFEEPDLD